MPMTRLTRNVTFTRLDSLAANSPGRFISGIAVDPADPNHAWIVYSSYSTLDPTTPGHVFSVTFDPECGQAQLGRVSTDREPERSRTFRRLASPLILVRGDLYASNDWGVLRLPNGSTNWVVAGTGLPNVEVSGLTDCAHRAKALRRDAWPKRLATDIAIKLR